MYYIGIDVGKEKHCACVTNQYGEILVQPFFFSNNQKGFNYFINVVKPYFKELHIVGLEATGHYGDNLIKLLFQYNCSICIINPIVTSAARKASIRKVKNDKVDSIMICNVLSSSSYPLLTKEKYQLREMKQLTRCRANKKEEINQRKNKIQHCIDIIFPEYNSLFKCKYSYAYIQVLIKYRSAYNVSKARISSLRKVLNSKGIGSKVTLTAEKLKQGAKQSIGEHNDTIIDQLRFEIELLQLLESQLEIIDEKIEVFASESTSPIFSIPGVGSYSGTVFLCELGDISAFDSASKIIGYAGMDPSVYQSGNYNAVGTSISKRGSPYLRKSIVSDCFASM